jgi:hypothetical protein
MIQFLNADFTLTMVQLFQSGIEPIQNHTLAFFDELLNMREMALSNTALNGRRSCKRNNSHFHMDPVPFTIVLEAFTSPMNADDHPSPQSNNDAECDFRDGRIFSLVDNADL